MHTTHANTAADSRSDRAKQLEREHGPAPDATEVYALHVEPADMEGFLLDVYGDRADAVADAELLADEETSTSIRPYRVETAEQALGAVR